MGTNNNFLSGVIVATVGGILCFYINEKYIRQTINSPVSIAASSGGSTNKPSENTTSSKPTPSQKMAVNSPGASPPSGVPDMNRTVVKEPTSNGRDSLRLNPKAISGTVPDEKPTDAIETRPDSRNANPATTFPEAHLETRDSFESSKVVGVVRIRVNGTKNVIAFSKKSGTPISSNKTITSNKKYHLFLNDENMKYIIEINGDGNIVEGGSKTSFNNIEVQNLGNSHNTKKRYAVRAVKKQ